MTNRVTMNKKTTYFLAITGLLLLLIAAVLFSLSVGEMHIGLGDALRLLAGGGNSDSLEYMLVTQVRLPRIMLGMAVGGALSLAGAMLQGVYRNPLVEPFTLGISGGASLGVAAVIVLGWQASLGGLLLPLAGFAGALAVLALVWFFGTRKRQVNIQHILLVGVMVSFICSSGMMFLMSIASSESLHGIVFWTMGSLDEPNTALVWITVGATIAVLALSLLFVNPLNALRLGEERALHLGVNTQLAVKLLFVLASVLTGLCVAVAGVIGFVGLIVPHLVRLMFGNDYRILLAGSFLLGASFLLLSDVAARSIIAPNELPIGVITGLVGGVVFIFLMSRKIAR